MFTFANHEFNSYIILLCVLVFCLATIRLLIYVYIGHTIQSKSEKPLAALQNAELLKLPEYIQIRLRTLILQWTPREPVYLSAFDIIHIGPWLIAPGPHRLIAPSDLSPNTDLRLQFTATLPTVALVHICSDGGHPPGPVTKLQVYNVTYNEVLLIWKDHRLATKCIRTYEIEFQPDVIGNEIDNQLFKRINSGDVIFLWYQYVTTGVPETTRGVYRARAVDYWDRTGPYSTSVRFPDEN